jgi:hypothetical protein
MPTGASRRTVMEETHRSIRRLPGCHAIYSAFASSAPAVASITTATPQQVQEAVRVNTEARLRALKIGLLVMACLALLAVFPAGKLPNYLPGEIPSDEPAARGAKSA